MDFTADELTFMRDAQTGHMLDTGYLQAYSESFNSFGEPAKVYTESGTSTDCGLDMRPGIERHLADKTTTTYDATVRLPITATPSVRDRIRITARFGEALATPLIFDILAPIQRGPSGIRLLLRKIET